MASIAEIRAKYPQYEDMSDQELADALYSKFYADMDRAEFNKQVGLADPYKERARIEAEKARDSNPLRGTVLDKGILGSSGQDFVANAVSGIPFGDEVAAGLSTPIRMLTDQVGPQEAYKRQQAFINERAALAREDSPVAATMGAVTTGLGMAGGAASKGVTLAGRTGTSTVGRALGGLAEGATYGALYGAGDPREGETRLESAGKGGVIGGVTGGILGAGAGAIANRSAHVAASKAAPTVQQLSDDANALYSAMRQEGVNINQGASQKLAATVKQAAGNANARLRPNTLGVVREIDQAGKAPMTLEMFDELRQGVNDALKTAKPGDSRTLMKIKTAMDNFARTMKPGDFTGDAQKAVGFLEKAREVYARKAKTELVENIIDKVDVKTGQYTQSGIANAIRTVMRQTYFNKSILSQFSKEEQALIRQMAKGGSNSAVVNLLAKFAPRGPVSAAVSTMLGNATMGPAGFVIGPAIGQAAAKSADRGAAKALEILRTSAATGGAGNATPALPGRGSNALIAPAVQQTQAIRP